MSSISAPEIIIVNDDVNEVRCDGGGGALGHPVVWYTFDGKDYAECGYCDRLFIKKHAAEGKDGEALKRLSGQSGTAAE